MSRKDRPQTPDGRYFVARAKLCRMTNPALPDAERRAALKALMQARLATRRGGPGAEAARAAVDDAKRRLGERGPVWWSDGAPDEDGLDPAASTYAGWWAGLSDAERDRGRA